MSVLWFSELPFNPLAEFSLPLALIVVNVSLAIVVISHSVSRIFWVSITIQHLDIHSYFVFIIALHSSMYVTTGMSSVLEYIAVCMVYTIEISTHFASHQWPNNVMDSKEKESRTSTKEHKWKNNIR